MERMISWSNQVPLSKNRSMWGGILLWEYLLLVGFTVFYFIVKFIYDLALGKDFGIIWSMQTCFEMFILMTFLFFFQILWMSLDGMKTDVTYSLDEDGVKTNSYLSYTGSDEGGNEVQNNFTSSRHLSWHNVRSIKINEKTQVILLKGQPGNLQVTLHCEPYGFKDAIDFIKNQIDTSRIREIH